MAVPKEYAAHFTEKEWRGVSAILSGGHPLDRQHIQELFHIIVDNPPEPVHDGNDAVTLFLDYGGSLVGLAEDIEVTEEEARTAEAVVEELRGTVPGQPVEIDATDAAEVEAARALYRSRSLSRLESEVLRLTYALDADCTPAPIDLMASYLKIPRERVVAIQRKLRNRIGAAK